MPSPKDPEKYAVYVEKQRKAHLGKIPWNKGLTKSQDKRIKGGRENGFVSHRKEMTYEQEYGEEQALLLRKKLSCIKRNINLDDFDIFAKPLHRRLRNSSRWKQWRSKVFERDKYCCQKCASTENLQPHHIISVSKCINSDMIDLIFDVGNGITLCSKCHLKTGIHRGE